MRTIELRQERRLLDAFVTQAKEMPLVQAIWADFGSSLDLTVVVSGRNLEGELRLLAMFQKLSASTRRPSCGEFVVVLQPHEPANMAALLFTRSERLGHVQSGGARG